MYIVLSTLCLRSPRVVLRAQRLLSDEQPSSASSCNLLVDTLFCRYNLHMHLLMVFFFWSSCFQFRADSSSQTTGYSIITAPLEMSFVSRALVFWASLVVSVARAAQQRPLFASPGLAIECPSLSLPAKKAASAVEKESSHGCSQVRSQCCV